jgi:hypothetical protein
MVDGMLEKFRGLIHVTDKQKKSSSSLNSSLDRDTKYFQHP